MASERIAFAEFMAEMHRTISRDRLESYRPANGDDLDMLVTYFWNIALSEALHPTILTFEVALRNTIHATLSSAYRSAYWFDRPHLLLPRELKEIESIRGYLASDGKPMNDGRIIAGSTFRLWFWLFNRPYEARIWHPNNQLLLRTAFPRLPRPFRNRASVEQRCNDIRILRNRISHAEAIWHRPNLHEEHRNILRAIRWISPALEKTVRDLDRFDAIFRNGRATIEQDLRRRVDVP